MKLKPKPIVKKVQEETNKINEKVNRVRTFPHLKRKPSPYKLLDKKQETKEDKIEDIETITNLIKQLGRKEFDPFEPIKRVSSRASRIENQHIKFDLVSPKPSKFKEDDIFNSTTLAEDSSARKRRERMTYLPKVININAKDKLPFEISQKDLDKDIYYSTLYTENNYGKKIKSFSFPIQEHDENYNKIIKNLLFDNKIQNHKHYHQLYEFSQIKKDHFKLFESMRFLKSTKSGAMKEKKTLRKIKKPDKIEKQPKYVTLQKAYLVPLDKIDNFKLQLINNYISQIDYFSKDNKKRKIFVIVDGTVIINSNYIPGFCIEMPTRAYLLKLSPEMQTKYYENFLKLCRGRINSKCWFKNIINQRLKLIVDLAEIEEEDKFIFISASNSYQGISLPLSNNIMQSYGENYNQWKTIEKEENNSSEEDFKEDNNGDNVYEVYFDDKNKICNDEMYNRFEKSREIYKINQQKFSEKTLKKQRSFNFGNETIDTDTLSNDYFYYSDNEKRVKKIQEFIKSTLPTRGAFFIYIQNNIYDTKLKNIRKKFTENKEELRNTKNSFKTPTKYSSLTAEKSICDYLTKSKIRKNYIQPQTKGVLTTQELVEGMVYLSQDDPKINLNTIHNKRKNEKRYNGENSHLHMIEKNIKMNTNNYLENEKKIQTSYPHLVSYNIPHILSLDKHFTRKQLFTFFTQFKSLIALWLSIHQNIPISVYGIDFEMFKQCIPPLRNEDEILLKKIFKQMNKSNSTLLSLDEFIEGMSMLNRQITKDKINFFLEVFDNNHTGFFTYEEVKKISTIAIKRLLVNNETQSNLIDELKDFLADFVFEIVNCNKRDGLCIDKLKEIMMKMKENDSESEYFEIFCCANKLK